MTLPTYVLQFFSLISDGLGGVYHYHINIISGPLSIEPKINYVFNVFFHYSPHFFPVLATCLVDLPEVTGTHRKFRSIVSSLIGMD